MQFLSQCLEIWKGHRPVYPIALVLAAYSHDASRIVALRGYVIHRSDRPFATEHIGLPARDDMLLQELARVRQVMGPAVQLPRLLSCYFYCAIAIA